MKKDINKKHFSTGLIFLEDFFGKEFDLSKTDKSYLLCLKDAGFNELQGYYDVVLKLVDYAFENENAFTIEILRTKSYKSFDRIHDSMNRLPHIYLDNNYIITATLHEQLLVLDSNTNTFQKERIRKTSLEELFEFDSDNINAFLDVIMPLIKD